MLPQNECQNPLGSQLYQKISKTLIGIPLYIRPLLESLGICICCVNLPPPPPAGPC